MKKNIASQKVGCQMCSATDGSAFTSTVTVYVTVDAGTQALGATASGVCTHEGNGYHTYAPSQGETNGDLVAFTFIGTGAIPATVQIYTRPTTGLLAPATADRTVVVDASGLVDANTVKLGPSGSGTAQTARDIGTSVLLSSGTGTGQVKLSAGYVAPNWGDVGNPTTVVGLTGTTVKTATDVETDTADIQSRLPAALGANGNIKADVRDLLGTAWLTPGTAGTPDVNTKLAGGTAWGSGAITAAAIASDAITAAKIADGAIDTATFASGTTIPRCTLTDTVTAVTGLTASNLDTTVSSRMATYTQPTGFLAATFPGTVASPTNITAGTITTVTNLTNAATSGDLTATMKTSVNDQVVDALATDTYAEPGQGTPSATLSLAGKLNYLFKAWRNKSTQTSTAYNLYNDDAATVDQKATTSDDGTTFSRGEISTGP